MQSAFAQVGLQGSGRQYDTAVKPGAYRTGEYLPLLQGRRVALVANHTSVLGGRHLADTLLSRGINIVRVFGPEHGFRGNASDGALVAGGRDSLTGLEVVSLYGDHKKPTSADLQGIDIMVFDIQDVGVRFYTYISTLSYVMEACAEKRIPLVVLDRPNPNGFYIDGPMLEPSCSSFVGLHPVPVVYGMTIGEYARMVNGEQWLNNKVQCDLKVIPCIGYRHSSLYRLPVIPSPNLTSMDAVYLYPSLGLFEGTVVSVGRGTERPFTMIGHPLYRKAGNFIFTPVSRPGISDNPPYKNKTCYGLDLQNSASIVLKSKKIQLNWIQTMYLQYPDKSKFFNNYFSKLAGNKTLRLQIAKKLPESEIRKSWQSQIRKFIAVRQKYLLYD